MVKLEKLFTRLSKNGEYDVLAAVVNAETSSSIEIIARRAEAHYKNQEWAAAIEDFATVVAARAGDARPGWRYRARLAMAQLNLSKDELAATWRRFSDQDSLEMGPVSERLRRGDLAGIETEFSEIIDRLVPDPAAASSWKSSFGILVAAVGGETVGEVEPWQKKRKLIVSGMGWSGSGAIDDYLREHEGTFSPFQGESTLLEGPEGFSRFVHVRQTRQGLIDQSVDFFFRSMLGFLPMTTARCFGEIHRARTNSLAPESAKQYAQSAVRVVRAMAGLITAPEGNTATVEQRLGVLCDAIMDDLINYTAPEGKVILLDNCIHIMNIHLLKYASNTALICCMRDTRTNFVARKRESPGFTLTVDEYVAHTKKLRATFEKNLPALVDALARKGTATTIHPVAFETFITSEDFRNRISKAVGLDPEKRDKFAYLKPWESFRNTQLHLDYENQEEMDAIRAAVPEYCVDLQAVPLEGGAGGTGGNLRPPYPARASRPALGNADIPSSEPRAAVPASALAGLSWSVDLPDPRSAGWVDVGNSGIVPYAGKTTPCAEGFTIPAGVAGERANFFNYVPIPDARELAGRTLRITATYDATPGFLDSVTLSPSAILTRRGGAGGFRSCVQRSVTQQGGRITATADYVIHPTDEQIAPVFRITSAGPAQDRDRSVRLVSLRAEMVSDVPADGRATYNIRRLLERGSTAQSAIGAQAGAIPAISCNVTGSVLDQGFSLETPVLRLSQARAPVEIPAQAWAIDPPAAESVSDHAFTLVHSTNTINGGTALPHQYISDPVVTRISDDVVLIKGEDYQITPDRCYIYGLKSIANERCRISYTGHLHRYDLISVSTATGALTLTKGTERVFDPEEWKALVPAGDLLLWTVYVNRYGCDLLPSWRYLGGVDALSRAAHATWLERARAALPNLLRKLPATQSVDQGRSLWFVQSCDVRRGKRIADLVGREPRYHAMVGPHPG